MLEVCVDTIEAAHCAVAAGADRIELCTALEIGGVTPSAPLIASVRAAVNVPLVVLIRCRGGKFEYSHTDRLLMLQEASHALQLGADGIAVGGLQPGGQLDVELLTAMSELAGSKQLVMHRAFDAVADPHEALESLIAWGYSRVLTSGGKPSALCGAVTLATLQKQSCRRIEILPGGGVTPTNAAEILERTGCTQLHGSFRSAADPFQPDSAAISKTKGLLERRG